MKKIAFVVLMIIMIAPRTVISNPIYVPSPQIFISELTFTSPSAWVLELETQIYQFDPSWLSASTFDSVIIQSNQSRVRLMNFPIAYYQLFVVNPSTFGNNLTIDPDQDSLEVITYLNPQMFPEPVVVHLLVYGYPECEIPLFSQGQSISAHRALDIPEYFYLDNSPTPDAENDTIGATVNMSGRFYDHHGNQITATPSGHNFVLPINVDRAALNTYPGFAPLNAFTFDNEGNYHTQFLSRYLRNFYVSYMDMVYPYFALQYINLPCSTYTYFAQPGENLNVDLNLTDDTFLVGVKPDPANETSVICYPNPVNGTGRFLVTSADAAGGEIVICNMSGISVFQLTIPPEKKSELTFTRGNLGGSGLYLYSVVKNGKKISSGQIICR